MTTKDLFGTDNPTREQITAVVTFWDFINKPCKTDERHFPIKRKSCLECMDEIVDILTKLHGTKVS